MAEGPQVVSVVAPPTGGWTIETYAIHNEALRAAETRFQDERDRRYGELAIEREKALKIKETADLAALSLAREIQTYKDEKANELRSQIERERGTYASQSDLHGAIEKVEETLKPIVAYVSNQQGRTGGAIDTRTLFFAVPGVVASVIAVLIGLAVLLK